MEFTLIELLRAEFKKVILTKPDWRKNEVMVVFDKAYMEATIQYAKNKGKLITK